MPRAANSNLPIFYTYILLDPRKPGKRRYGHWVFHYEPFYIGKGKGERWRMHTKEVLANKSKNTYKARKIKNIHSTGKEVLVRLIRNLTELEAYELEKKLISKIGKGKFGPLTNLTDGGDGGMLGSVITKATKKKRLASYKLTVASRTKQDRIKVGLNIKKGQAKRSRKQKLSRNEKISIGTKKYKAKLSSKKRAELYKKISISNKLYWESLSSRKRKAIIEKMRKAQNALPAKRKAITSAKMSAAHRNKSPKEKAIIVAKRLATKMNKSPKEKAITSAKMSASATKAWEKRRRRSKA
jgi:hypothetical protein